MHKRMFWLGLLLILLFVGGGWMLQPSAEALILDPLKETAISEDGLFKEAWRIVNRAYLDETFNGQNWWLVRQKVLRRPPKTRQETYVAIEKMLASLDDPFTRLLRPEQYRSLKVSTSGELTGVGLQIGLDAEMKTIEVVAPIAGSPADRAGIQPHDRILEIDGSPTTEMTLDESAARMRGPAGTGVTLLLERAMEQRQETVELVRDRIALNPVVAKLRAQATADPIGYIQLNQFSAKATAEVARAIEQLADQGATSYVLDLRGNPGGLLEAGIEVARLWLDRGAIVYTVDRRGVIGSFDAEGQALTEAPLVLLVNRGTASASEILAGALHDNGRAQIVGERTFGKGLIQSLFDLADGSGLAVTVAKYETPNHQDINRLGIVPDEVVSLGAIARDQLGTTADAQYQAAVKLLTTELLTTKQVTTKQVTTKQVTTELTTAKVASGAP